MKLVHCPDCMDVFAVRMKAWRTDPEFESWSAQKRGAVHRKWGYGPNEIWWGGHAGDWQLIRIDSPNGPRRSHPAVLKEIIRILRGQKRTKAQIRKVLEYVGDSRKRYRAARKRKEDWKKFRTKNSQ